jgi:hypothetical protein
MSVAVLPIIIPNWKQHKCLSIEEQINEIEILYRNKSEQTAGKQQIEESQWHFVKQKPATKNKYSMILFMWSSEISKSNQWW